MRLFSSDTKAEALGQTPLFEGLSRKELKLLAQATEDVEVEAGRVLAKEGDAAQEFFIIVEGEVRVTSEDRELRTLGPGDFFGEIALVEHTTRTATVTAMTPLRFFVLTSQGFWRLLDENPTVERQVLRALAKRLLDDQSDSDPQ